MSDTTTPMDPLEYGNDPTTIQSQFAQDTATIPLRVCCYGSSSAQTPVRFLREAWNLGYILARRGHTCVNGAGSYGCMAAMNDGADAGDGRIVGVIHEMFLVDGNDFVDRDGGAHSVFSGGGGSTTTKKKREILIAGGQDLQERKRLLVDGAHALIVLPGGPGTWDELWEMACARNLGLTNLPIVCVSVDKFYDSFAEMLERAYGEGLVKNKPQDVVHFVPSAEDAVRWIEATHLRQTGVVRPKVKTRASILKRASFMSTPVLTRPFRWLSSDGGESNGKFWKDHGFHLALASATFAAGACVGLLAARHPAK